MQLFSANKDLDIIIFFYFILLGIIFGRCNGVLNSLEIKAPKPRSVYSYLSVLQENRYQFKYSGSSNAVSVNFSC